jgi:hypothetical protein
MKLPDQNKEASVRASIGKENFAPILFGSVCVVSAIIGIPFAGRI